MSKEKDEKYIWDISKGLFPIIDPHSKIKHQIFEDYLKEYVSVLMKNPNIRELYLSIVDGFCGGGQYWDIKEGADIHLGSPLISINAIKEAEVELNKGRHIQRKIITQNFFIDINQQYIDCLKAVLHTQGQINRLDKDIFLICSEFTKVLPTIIHKIQQQGKGNRALFLLDQYAYKDVPFDAIKKIFRSVKNAEVLLTFNVDSLIDYLSDTTTNRKAVSNIGLERHIPWQEIKKLKIENKYEWQYIIQQKLSEGILIECEAEFMTIFFVKPKGSNSRAYWFIHMANSYRANDVMKEIHWRYGNNFSHMLTPALFIGYDANKDIRVTMHEDLLSATEHNFDNVTNQKIIDTLSEKLPRIIYEKNAIPFANLMYNITNFTMATEEKIKEALDYAIETKDIQVFSKDKKTKRRKGSSIHIGDIIETPPQKIMFFLPPDFNPKQK